MKEAINKAHEAVKMLWNEATSLTIGQVKDLVREKEEREQHNNAQHQELSDQDAKVIEALVARIRSEGPEPFGESDNA